MTVTASRILFREIMRPNSRPYSLADDQDADLVGMRLYGGGPFHREHKSAIQIVKKTHFVIKKGDVIYNKLFAWKGTFGIVPTELDGMYVSDKFPTYELDRSKVHDEYLSWFFRHTDVWEQARLMSIGSAALSKLTLNPPRFLELKIPLPSLEEQVRIASKLNLLATKIAAAKDLREEANEHASSAIWGICESYLNECRSAFESKALSKLVDEERGISYGIVQTGKEYEGGVPTLRAGDLQWFNVKTRAVKKVDPSIERAFQRTRLKGNELLLRIRGGVGELAVCPKEMVGGNVSREIAVIPLDATVDPNFAMYMLAAPTSQSRMHGHIRGTSYVGINLKDVRTIEIPRPPMDQQQHVIEKINVLRNKIEKVRQLQAGTTKELHAMLPSILDKAFRGEL